MTNEMKLLRAFIEASGYEVEEVEKKLVPKGCDAAGIDRIETSYKVTKKGKSVMSKIDEDREIELITGRTL